MGDDDGDLSDLEKWDPGFIEWARKVAGPIGKIWFRAEVRGLERMPPTGGALLVSNHSGGAMTPDVLVLAPAFYEKLGYERPLYTLAHYGLFKTPLAGTLRKIGVLGGLAQEVEAQQHEVPEEPMDLRVRGRRAQRRAKRLSHGG